MLWLPQKGPLLVEHNTGAVGVASVGTSVTTGAASGTKGSATQLIAATAFDAYRIIVCANNYGNNTSASGGVLDIMVGSATEEVLIPDLLMGNAGQFNQGPKVWDFPLYIPAGARLSARAAGERTSTAMFVAVWLYGGNGYPPFRVGSKVTSYGIGSTPAGTAITPGQNNAEGAWTEIVASTSEDHFAFVPSFQLLGDGTMGVRTFQVDVGIGSATEELVGSYWFTTTSSETTGGPINATPVFQDIPSGTRLAMRASNSSTNDSGYEGAIHAVS